MDGSNWGRETKRSYLTEDFLNFFSGKETMVFSVAVC